MGPSWGERGKKAVGEPRQFFIAYRAIGGLQLQACDFILFSKNIINFEKFLTYLEDRDINIYIYIYIYIKYIYI